MKSSKLTQPSPISSLPEEIAFQFILSLCLFIPSLGLGMSGYAYFEKFGWADSFINTAMLLGGIRPVSAPQTEGGKIFAGCFALYAGLLYVLIGAILLTPIAHRILHAFHLKMRDE